MTVAAAANGVAVDLAIAVHSRARPIGRAVESVAQAGLPLNKPGGVRITVVCHNIEIVEISSAISSHLSPEVRFLSLKDGIPSPAGPLNLGLEEASAPYASVMGSDDYLESGALRQWLDVAVRHGSDVVIAPQRHADGRKVRTPVNRVGRRRKLDPVRDRLAYRTAPLGLISTAEIKRLGLRFTPGLPTGEDQEFSARLWFGGGRFDYAGGTGRYVVGADANDRVTHVHRSVPETLDFAVRLVNGEWFGARSLRERRSMAAKLIRVHVFGLVESRSSSGGWSSQDRRDLAQILQTILDSAEGVLDPFSRADHRMVAAVLEARCPQSVLMDLARARRVFRSPATLLPARAAAALNPESPLRFLPASALLR